MAAAVARIRAPGEKRFQWFNVLNGFILLLCMLSCLLPFWYVIISSVSRVEGLRIQGFTLDAYRYIFSTRVLPRSLQVSIVTTIIGTFCMLAVTSLMAYSLAEKDLPGRAFFLNLVIFTMLFSGGMIPLFFVVRATRLFNTIWAMIIPNLVSAFNLIVMKNFFQNVPYEMKESARMDGCHELIILVKIILPLSLPALATFGLFYAVGIWNTFMSAVLYIQRADLWPIQVLLRRIVQVSVGLGDSDLIDANLVALSQNIRMAAILVATIPIMCIYPFLQKHFAKGIMVGSVKG